MGQAVHRRPPSTLQSHCSDGPLRSGFSRGFQCCCKQSEVIQFADIATYRGPVVIRILRTRVRPERALDFRERALVKAADARKVPGVIDVHLGNQADSRGYEYVFISRWESIDALYAWAGGRDLLARPIYFEDLDDALLDFDIQHYVDVEATD